MQLRKFLLYGRFHLKFWRHAKVGMQVIRIFSILCLGFVTSVSHAGIQGSKHDLTSSVGGTSEVCVFCHTPHGGDTSAAAPLWNKVLPDSTSFQTYDQLGTATLDGEVDLASGGISLACLSCHDGTSALDLVRNAPTVSQGVYRYNAAGAVLSNGTKMTDIASAPVPVLEKDLRNDHPIGVQFAGGGLTWGAIGGTNTVAESANDKLFHDPIWNNKRLWVGEIGGDGLPLYNGFLGPTVECASCHDPHKTQYGTFLRKSNASSGLCLTCHVK